MNKTVQYILYMKPHTINHIEKHICEAHSALSSRNEETTAGLWDVTSCSLVNTHTNDTDERVTFKVNIEHRKKIQPVGIKQ